MRRFRLWISCSASAACLLAAPSAHAHHFLGTCDEVGEWSKSASARLGEYNKYMEVKAYVGRIPPVASCYDASNILRSNQRSTQHTSLHARRVVNGTSYCLETVAQRWHTGLIRMYGYNCQSGGAIHDIYNYGSTWMRLKLTSGGTYDWAHWYYRYDTGQWIYLGTTHSPCCRYYNSWLESSGYNESSTRGTYFREFRETRSDGSTGTSNYPCPVTEDFDRHQEEFPNVGGLAENTDWRPATVNSC